MKNAEGSQASEKQGVREKVQNACFQKILMAVKATDKRYGQLTFSLAPTVDQIGTSTLFECPNVALVLQGYCTIPALRR